MEFTFEFPDIVEFCEELAEKGKTIIVAALDGTFQRKPFGRVLELIPLAEEVTKLNAVCMVCRKDAAFTKRLGSETQVELIGGSDMYISVCRSCFSADQKKPSPILLNPLTKKLRLSQESLPILEIANKN
jgi:thymidine kinase